MLYNNILVNLYEIHSISREPENVTLVTLGQNLGQGLSLCLHRTRWQRRSQDLARGQRFVLISKFACRSARGVLL